VPYAGSTAPSGWLLCYGQQVSTSAYANLYTAIGTTYGSGSGTFGIPDLRGRAAFGADAMGGTAAGRLGSGNTGGITGSATLGASGGQQSHTLTTAEIPSGLGTFWNGSSGGQGLLDSAPNAAAIATTASAGGGGGAHNNTPPALVLNYIIKY
jgi:microcystin-dependent protein